MSSRYLEAFKKGDWKGVCATLTPKARQRLARKAGSCPAAYAKNKPSSAKYMLVSEVDVKGDRAVVTVSFNGIVDQKPEFKMYAARMDGEWLLYIKRAAKGAA